MDFESVTGSTKERLAKKKEEEYKKKMVKLERDRRIADKKLMREVTKKLADLNWKNEAESREKEAIKKGYKH